MDYDSIIIILKEHFMKLSEKYNNILKEYKNKCNESIMDNGTNRRIQDRLIEIIEDKILDLKKEIHELVTKYYASIYNYIDYIKTNKDENGLIPLIDELKKDKLSKKVYDKLYEISYELNKNLRNHLMQFGASERTLEEFNYEFRAMSRRNIERFFDDSDIGLLTSDIVKKLEEMIMNKSNSTVDLEGEWHK